MTYPLFGRGPDGILEISFGGMVEDYDKMAVCSWDHQRQPFLLRDIDGVTAQDVAVAIKKSRGDIGFVPMSTARSFTIEAGSPDQKEQANEGVRPFVYGDKCPAYHRLDKNKGQFLRNLLVVASEDSTGLITPFANMLTHQWYDDCEDRYNDAGRFRDARRFHFYVVNTLDAINMCPDDIGV